MKEFTVKLISFANHKRITFIIQAIDLDQAIMVAGRYIETTSKMQLILEEIRLADKVVFLGTGQKAIQTSAQFKALEVLDPIEEVEEPAKDEEKQNTSKYISIAEYAEMLGITPQAIYKKLDQEPYKSYLVKGRKSKCFYRTILDIV